MGAGSGAAGGAVSDVHMRVCVVVCYVLPVIIDCHTLPFPAPYRRQICQFCDVAAFESYFSVRDWLSGSSMRANVTYVLPQERESQTVLCGTRSLFNMS